MQHYKCSVILPCYDNDSGRNGGFWEKCFLGRRGFILLQFHEWPLGRVSEMLVGEFCYLWTKTG